MENDNSLFKKIIRPLAALVLIIVGAAGVWLFIGNLPEKKDSAAKEEVSLTSPFDNVYITAKAAYVYDARTKEVLYAKNEDLRLPLASVTKAMTALVAKEESAPDKVIVVGSDALSVTGDSGLYKGERWSLKDLLDFSLTSSSNDGMQAIANSLGALNQLSATPEERGEDFVRQMNKKAEELSMKNTYFFNPTGLDESVIQGGAYGTAKDITVLFDYILRYYPSLLEATKNREITVNSLDNLVHTAENTDSNVSEIPGIKASKTGFTDIAGGNLVVAFDPELGRPIIITVLGSTAEDRFTDVLTLVKASMKSLTQKDS